MNALKTWMMILGIIGVVPGLALMMQNLDSSPENKLLGSWREVSWAYEKVDKSKTAKDEWIEDIDDHVKREIYDHLVIHQAEVWKFFPGSKLMLMDENDNSISVIWKLKGRGNLLELMHENREIEPYTVQELTDKLLVIHFNSDLQVRGIVKMTFERID